MSFRISFCLCLFLEEFLVPKECLLFQGCKLHLLLLVLLFLLLCLGLKHGDKFSLSTIFVCHLRLVKTDLLLSRL